MRFDVVLEAFSTLARRDGRAPVVASPSAAATRGEIVDLAVAAARDLVATGAPPGSLVLLACANGAGFLAALLGARRAGLVPVLADRSAPEDERRRVAAALGVAAQITCDRAFPTECSDLRVARCGGTPAEAPPSAAYVKLTSGSSGAPSGVAIAAEALAADDDQLASTMEIVPSDRFVAVIPWSHSYGLSSLVMPALRRGSLLVVPADASPWGPVESARALSATVFPTVPAYLQAISELAAPPSWPETLRTVISAGATLAPDTSARFRETFGCSVHVFYGASESGGITYDRKGGAAERGTVGTPVDGVSIGLDADGAVVVRSKALGLGHVPVRDGKLGGGTFRSADLAAWTDDGELTLLGRADALINVGGKKVHPAEIESILRAMPGVRDVHVLGVASTGGARTIVRAIVACDPGAVSHADVVSWCRDRLASHKVPRSIVRLPRIPRTARGKIDLAALAELDGAAHR
jgi:long-chain acyl-CoA synthetase